MMIEWGKMTEVETISAAVEAMSYLRLESKLEVVKKSFTQEIELEELQVLVEAILEDK